MDHHQWKFPEKHEHTSEEDWEVFHEEMNKCFIKAQEGPDILRWGYSPRGSFSVKEAYSIRISRNAVSDDIWKKIWIVNLWPKVALFVWLVARGRILTCDNLRKRGILRPYQCCLFFQVEEMMSYFPDKCPFIAVV